MRTMIKKVRRRFIWIATCSLFLVMVISFASLIGLSYYKSSREADQVLAMVVANNGRFDQKQAKERLGDQYSREGVFKYRYFTAKVNTKKSTITVTDNKHIIQLSTDEVLARKKTLLAYLKAGKMSGSLRGKAGDFRYLAKKAGSNQYYICVIDIAPLMQSTLILARYAMLFLFIGISCFTLLMYLLADRAVKPIKEAYDRQRRFITNAGHELKTPLAVISANTEMEEIMGNDDEWTESTKEQVVRMTGLINDLITLTRMGEPEELVLSKVNFSEITEKSADSFKSLLAKAGKDYQVKIEKDICVNAESSSLGEVVNILIDNAQKYCDSHGKVTVSLEKGKLGQNAILTVTNSYQNGAGVDTARFFERFYREDESHHYDKQKKSGFGIGLSMASDLVQAFGGKINANWNKGVMTFTVSIKLKK